MLVKRRLIYYEFLLKGRFFIRDQDIKAINRDFSPHTKVKRGCFVYTDHLSGASGFYPENRENLIGFNSTWRN
jgi:hypothetical protein